MPSPLYFGHPRLDPITGQQICDSCWNGFHGGDECHPWNCKCLCGEQWAAGEEKDE